MKRIISVLLCALMIVAVMAIPATATTSYTFPKAAETFNLTDGKDPNGLPAEIALIRERVGHSIARGGRRAGSGAGLLPAVAAGSQAQRHGGSQDKSCYFFKFHFIVLLVNHFSQIIADWVKKIL